MKFGLIHYNAPGDTLGAFLDYAAGAGFDAVELQWRDVLDPADSSATCADKARRVREAVESRGLTVGAFSAGNDFVVDDPPVVDEQVARMKLICEVALLLGTNIIRSEGGRPNESIAQDRWADAMANCFRKCVPFLEDLDVYLGLDNHGVVTNDGYLQMQILGMVGSRYVGTTIDTMNYRWMGHELETCNRFVELSSYRAVHMHFKDGTGSRGEYRGCALGDGEIDLEHAIRCLKANDYQGLWCAEYEGREPDGYTRCLEWMKAHVPSG